MRLSMETQSSSEDATKVKEQRKTATNEELSKDGQYTSEAGGNKEAGNASGDDMKAASTTQQNGGMGTDRMDTDEPNTSDLSAGTSAAGTTGMNTKQSASNEKEKKATSGDTEGMNGASRSSDNAGASSGAQSSTAASGASSSPPPPVLRGTLSCNTELRRHLIRGMWNYENSNAFPPQRFELVRNLGPTEDPTELPKDGEFSGSFSLAYFHTTSKGKQKERSKVIPESGVKIKFTKIEGEEGHFKVDGTGTNQFGIFHINGTANPTPHDDGQFSIVLRKRYEPSSHPPASAPAEGEQGKKVKKRKMGSISNGNDFADNDEGPLPPPSQSFEKNVVCLRGKVYKEASDELGTTDIVHRIHGMWSSGLDLILADPQNVRGLCNRFEYEHKSSVPSASFPVSGRYSGWFDLNLDDGTKKKIVEKDVTLRFRKNDAGHYNVEGRGSNAFGKYNITGTLTMDNVITIFRHFQAKKSKASRPVTSAPPPINAPGQTRKPAVPAAPEPQLKMDEVKVPEGDEPLEPLKPPEHPTYSAVSRGVLRLNDDGSLSCQGKWAVTREHFTNGQTSNFTFRLEAHFAAEALKNSVDREFPLDSEMYKGSFQLKKGGSRYQTVIDQQIVMKFRTNTTGSYNVYGRGVNAIGVFDLTGTLIMSGKTGGQVEVYRMYRPELLAAPAAAPTKSPIPATALSAPKAAPATIPSESAPAASSSAPAVPGPLKGGLIRRESTRLVKVPSRLEDDDPTAQLQRIMEKCTAILRFIREKDVERGAFFSEPVDPVALGIPTYHQVIKEPMDLRTLTQRMEAKNVSSPEEFARLARLVFENAMTFNIDPTHSVHQAARNLLILFNQKYRDVERMVTTWRRSQKGGDDDKKKKGKEDKKRKREADDTRSLKRRRLDEAQEMAAANAASMTAIAGAVPRDPNASVTRNEFSLMLQMITQLQQQITQTYTAVAEMSSDEPGSGAIAAVPDSVSGVPVPAAEVVAPPVVEKKQKPKKKAEPKPVEKPAVVEEDSRPLTLQEQELLTETINELPNDHLHGVIQIIRDAAKLTGEEDEIDLEIDQLDTVTQRKLLRHVSKFIKQPKRQKAPKKSKPAAAAQPKKTEPPPKKAKSSAPPKKKDPDSFFAFGSKADSDSDSEGEIVSPEAAAPPESAPAAATAAKEQFNLGEGFGGDDESDNGDDMDTGAAATWNIAQPATESKSKGGDDDDGWGAAREAAAAAKAREEDKKKREEKMKLEAEQAENQRLADAVARGEEIKAQRQAEKEEEARLKELEEKEAEEKRQKAREEARAQVQSVEQTVDLEAQRVIMTQFEQNFMEKEMGGASPSSDFGF